MHEAVRLSSLVRECLVKVTVADRMGSGFFAAPGFVLTCAHVVGRAREVTVEWNGQKCDAVVAGAEPALSASSDEIVSYPDVAVLRVRDAPAEHPCAWLDFRLPSPGTELMVVGYSDVFETEWNSADVRLRYDGLYGSWLRFVDGELTPGMSGGPVFNPQSGGICGLAKTNQQSNTRLGGLAVPLRGLRRVDRSLYGELCRAHDRYHGEASRTWSALVDALIDEGCQISERALRPLPMWPGELPRRELWPSEERDLRALLATLPENDEHAARFRRAGPPGCPAPADPLRDHGDVVTELSELVPPRAGLPYVLAYAADLARDTSGGTLTPLVSWVLLTAGTLRLKSDALARLQPAAEELASVRPHSSHNDHERPAKPDLGQLERSRYWPPETAATFRTSTSSPGVPAASPDRRLQAERILVGPLESEDVPPKLREAEAKRDSAPEESARLYAELARRLEVAGFRGHAAVLRDRQIAALRAADRWAQAVMVTVALAVDALDRGAREEARRLAHLLAMIIDEAGNPADGEATGTGHNSGPVTAAVNYLGDPLRRPESFVAELSRPGAETLPHHARLVLLLAEGMVAGHPQRITEIDGLLRSAIEQLGAAGWDEVGVRLRLVLAEYDQEERRALRSAARQHRVPGRLAALINAREARRCMLESRAAEAVASWRDAVQDGIHEGLTDDAADWLYSVRAVNFYFGPWTLGIDEEHHLAQALRRTGADRLLDRGRRPSEQARAAVLAQHPIEAVLSARQWLTDAVITGSWADEMEAARFLGNLYRDNAEPEVAAEFLARSGSVKDLVVLAERVEDRLIPLRLDRREPWWTLDAWIALAVAQADLLPDHDAAALLDELTVLASRGRAGDLAEPVHRRDLTDRATAGACALAHRGTPEQAQAVLDLLAADVPREPNHFQYSDDAQAAACVEIAATHPALAVPALTRLVDLARSGAHKAISMTAEERVVHLVRGCIRDGGPLLPTLSAEQRDALRAGVLRLAEGQSPVTQVLRHELAPDEPAAREAAQLARDRILARPEPTSGQVLSGSTMVTDAYLAGLLDEPDRMACIQKLLGVAEDSREAASNRQDALTAVTNLVIDATADHRMSIFPRSVPFVNGDQDGSAYDNELTGQAHPLSFFRISMGTATLRGHGLGLAAVAARDDADRRWVRDQAVDLLRSGEDSLIQRAALALASLPTEVTTDLDADLLAAHPHVNVRQLSAHMCVHQPQRYRTTALRLAKDSDARVRRILAQAAARVYAEDSEAVADLLEILASDVRHSVRAAARPNWLVRAANA